MMSIKADEKYGYFSRHFYDIDNSIDFGLFISGNRLNETSGRNNQVAEHIRIYNAKAQIDKLKKKKAESSAESKYFKGYLLEGGRKIRNMEISPFQHYQHLRKNSSITHISGEVDKSLITIEAVEDEENNQNMKSQLLS